MPHFNPRSPCGERPFAPMFRAAMYYFNPRSPCGERRPKTELSPIWTLFQSTLPVRGATGSRAWHWPPDNDFNPRSPCGERQMALSYKGMSQAISIHAPRAGSDTYYFFVPNRLVWISIHAPRAGSDLHLRPLPVHRTISIHAPRAGSDPDPPSHLTGSDDFNPRSPCGERLFIWTLISSLFHFNPRSPCGERQLLPMFPNKTVGFQSTLPVRGATGPGILNNLVNRFQSTLPVRGATASDPRVMDPY